MYVDKLKYCYYIFRKIVVHDTSPIYFLKLLNFIYTGKIDVTTGSTDQLTEILVLSDKYQLDSLKQSCDKTLSVRHLEKDNACFLLCLADQYNAPLLRVSKNLLFNNKTYH